MEKTDKDRLLNFLIGKENPSDFESWVYNDSDLELRLGSELYHELISFDYQGNDLLFRLKKAIIDTFISQEDFESFQYHNLLEEAGWYPGRSLEGNSPELSDSSEVKHAKRILKEFGGLNLKQVHYHRKDPFYFLEFYEMPGEVLNARKYGLAKILVCFASIHYGDSSLYVDEDNKYYQLDGIASEFLYQFVGDSFEQMMKELLEVSQHYSFQKINKRRIF